MSNIIDYINWRGDLSFKQDPFNEIDGLIFAELVFLNFHGIVSSLPNEQIGLYKAIEESLSHVKNESVGLGVFVPEQIFTVAHTILHKNRYSNVKLTAYSESIDKDKQFVAVTFILDDKSVFVSFRGTDDYISGWKENFMMAYADNIPAELDSLKYLETISPYFDRIMIGGHSKGGHLALYAATKTTDVIKNKIVKVYANDGYGLSKVSLEEINSIKDKIINVLPYDSVVGCMFINFGNRIVVKSSASGVMEHDGLSWQICGNKFITEPSVSENSMKLEITINELLNELSSPEKEKVVNNTFKAIEDLKMSTLTELMNVKGNLIVKYFTLDKETKVVIRRLVLAFRKYHAI